jgi:signal transduction histidine kinase
MVDPASEVSAADLGRAERLLTCFQKALGHELPNQLVAIQGLVYLLREEGERLGPEGRDCLQRLADVAQRTHTLVRELADVGRIARQQLPSGETKLSDAAREVLAEAKPLSSGPAVEYHIADPGLALPVAEGTLRQLLACLVRHALRRAGDRPVRLEVGARDTAAGLEVWLADDGPALPAAARQHLFEPFTGAAPAEGDSGLGLFLCSLLVDRCGGTLRVDSETGYGNRFTIALPCRP